MTEDELRLRHLADVQMIVARLSQHSFVIRGWSVTLVSVVFTILVGQGQRPVMLALVTLTPTLIFWALDAYYLRKERLFRYLYSAAARGLTHGAAATDVEPFDMDTTPYEPGVPGFLATLLTGHVVALPALLTVLILVYVVSSL